MVTCRAERFRRDIDPQHGANAQATQEVRRGSARPATKVENIGGSYTALFQAACEV